MNHFIRLGFLTLALCGLAACSGTGGGSSSGPTRSSGVEVFGTIDAGVSHTTNKSVREPAR